ncbi:protein of unknown function [Halogranum gelatinilyticum]|uniref:DUF4350 domain-containing protein n=1 Tax=Halogranum gelatinilyticum TaxID=660521 RepID=A0A1G9X7I8_9EURY|nr:DUF4350 domain-containing protein [Halogranum gelatinilyticum]SDM92285.1 protein of unknown function [Halogranum gelatinilyticum]
MLLVALLGVVVIAFVIAASTSTTAFGVYNNAWDGASELQNQAEASGVEGEIILNTSQYPTVQANTTVAFVLSPGQAYSPRETEQVSQFVREGGTLVVAEDFGPHSNSLLSAVGANASVDGRPLRDEQNLYRSPAMPVATNVTNTSLTRDVEQLTINHGTVVEPNGTQVLVRSSEFSYLDTNGNEELDENESLQEHPVVTVESVGEGRVVVVSDPSLFINTMLEQPGNQQFAENVLTAHDRVLLDYSHAGQQPPLAVALLSLRSTPLLQVVFGSVGIGAIALWLQPPTALKRVLGREESRPAESVVDGPAGEAALLTYLRRHHPEWEESRTQRVITGILDHQQDDSDND